jgi:hypothetical protein
VINSIWWKIFGVEPTILVHCGVSATGKGQWVRRRAPEQALGIVKGLGKGPHLAIDESVPILFCSAGVGYWPIRRLRSGPRRNRFRGDFPECLKPFASNRTFPIGKAGDIASGPRDVGNKATLDWLADADKQKRHRSHFCLQDRRYQFGVGHHQVRSQAHQLHGKSAYLVKIIGGISNVDMDVASLRTTHFLKPCVMG